MNTREKKCYNKNFTIIRQAVAESAEDGAPAEGEAAPQEGMDTD